jgi:hypothetical protein
MSVYGPLFVGTTRVVYKRAVIRHIRPPPPPNQDTSRNTAALESKNSYLRAMRVSFRKEGGVCGLTLNSNYSKDMKRRVFLAVFCWE